MFFKSYIGIQNSLSCELAGMPILVEKPKELCKGIIQLKKKKQMKNVRENTI